MISFRGGAQVAQLNAITESNHSFFTHRSSKTHKRTSSHFLRSPGDPKGSLRHELGFYSEPMKIIRRQSVNDAVRRNGQSFSQFAPGREKDKREDALL